MGLYTFAISGILGLLLASCATTKTYAIASKSGSETHGVVKFTQKGNMVELDMTVHNLASHGVHATHIHEFGDCSSADGSSAGGHWNPTKEKHGKWGNHEHHSGDLGNLKADINGTARLVMKTDRWCIGCQDEAKNIIGKSIIIHAKADDFKTQPTGDAGGRIGCAEIK